MEAGRRKPFGQTWWFDALLVAVIALAAFIASGDARILPAAIGIGLVFVGIRLLIRSGLGRVFSIPTAEEIPEDVERARKALPMVLGIAALVALLVVGRIVWVISDGNTPSVIGWIYLLLPLLAIGYFTVVIARKARG